MAEERANGFTREQQALVELTARQIGDDLEKRFDRRIIEHERGCPTKLRVAEIVARGSGASKAMTLLGHAIAGAIGAAAAIATVLAMIGKVGT